MASCLGISTAPSQHVHRARTHLGPRASAADPMQQIAARRASSAVRSRLSPVARVAAGFPTADGTAPQPRRLQIEIDSSRISEDMAAEIEAAVALAVHEAMEAELTVVQEAVASSVAKAMDEKDGGGFDLVANVNTFVGVTGIILFERGVWGCWDVVFEDLGVWSELTSIGVGLFILFSIQAFKIPLASWTKPGVDI